MKTKFLQEGTIVVDGNKEYWFSLSGYDVFFDCYFEMDGENYIAGWKKYFDVKEMKQLERPDVPTKVFELAVKKIRERITYTSRI